MYLVLWELQFGGPIVDGGTKRKGMEEPSPRNSSSFTLLKWVE